MDKIIIQFGNDNRTFEVPLDIAKSYPNSIFSLYLEFDSTGPIILKEITYEKFSTVYDILLGRTKQWETSSDIMSFMDSNGLTNNLICQMQWEFNKELESIDNFLHQTNPLWLPHNFGQYQRSKQLLLDNKNIMSFQMTYIENNLICLNILEKIPLYHCWRDGGARIIGVTSIDELEPLSNETDINEIRYKILIKDFCCVNCTECAECAESKCPGSSNFRRNCCYICNVHSYLYFGMPMFSEPTFQEMLNIYSDRTYMRNLHYILEYYHGPKNYGLRKVSYPKNIIEWNKIVPDLFLTNVNNSLVTIMNFLLKNYEFILDSHYARLPYQSHRPENMGLRTYYGFINLENVLK
jgi:hypothetical protein